MNDEWREQRRAWREERRAWREKRRVRPHVIGMRLSREAPWQRLIFGLSVLAAGIIFWLDHIGRINGHDYLRWWPVAVLAMGVAHLLERRWFGAAIWLLFGAYFFLPLIGVASARVWYVIGVWPLLITVAGVTLMMQAFRRGIENPNFRAIAVMGGNVRKVGAQLEAGEVLAFMGACDVDLTAAKIEHEAIVDVLAFWGGIGIKVPEGWNVVSRVTPILGGCENKTNDAPDGAPRLVVRGSAIMGGIDIRHPKESAA